MTFWYVQKQTVFGPFWFNLRNSSATSSLSIIKHNVSEIVCVRVFKLQIKFCRLLYTARDSRLWIIWNAILRTEPFLSRGRKITRLSPRTRSAPPSIYLQSSGKTWSARWDGFSWPELCGSLAPPENASPQREGLALSRPCDVRAPAIAVAPFCARSLAFRNLFAFARPSCVY